MSEFRFSIIVAGTPASDEDILDIADALAAAGCGDASVRGHIQGMELLFEREGTSLQDAIRSAIADVERTGQRVTKVELDREAISV